MNEKSTRSGSDRRRRGSSTRTGHGKSRATLRLIDGGALKATADRRSEPSDTPALLQEVQSAFNYCVYFCARWIGRIQRDRLEVAARP